jgi:hypothetical protein
VTRISINGSEQLLMACAMKYVEEGPSVTKGLRQAEVDGAMAFLYSDAAKPLRIELLPHQQREANHG